jgi:hypothetical protein
MLPARALRKESWKEEEVLRSRLNGAESPEGRCSAPLSAATKLLPSAFLLLASYIPYVSGL